MSIGTSPCIDAEGDLGGHAEAEDQQHDRIERNFRDGVKSCEDRLGDLSGKAPHAEDQAEREANQRREDEGEQERRQCGGGMLPEHSRADEIEEIQQRLQRGETATPWVQLPIACQIASISRTNTATSNARMRPREVRLEEASSNAKSLILSNGGAPAAPPRRKRSRWRLPRSPKRRASGRTWRGCRSSDTQRRSRSRDRFPRG